MYTAHSDSNRQLHVQLMQYTCSALQVQPQGNSESFLPAIKAPESTLRKQQTGVYAQGGKKGGIRSLQHQGSDRWAESKRDAGMVAYTASRWN